jgi:UDP-N-acetylmuramoyl-tripeptide--D-alanyl-D-alanine ligase
MNELGESSEQLHREIGSFVADKVDVLVTIGDQARKFLARSAKESGLPITQVHSFDTPYEAGEFLDKSVQAGDIVLIKGSQDKVYSEEAIKPILTSGLDASTVLVRQSEVWKARKRASFLESRS